MNGLRSIFCWALILDLKVCLKRKNISNIGSDVSIGSVDLFLRSQNEKPRTKPNKVSLD